MADAELTRAMIVNWALAEIGVAPKFTDASETELGAMVDIFWPRCQARAFGLHDWTFCRSTRKLIRQSATPINGWTYGFDLPGDRYGPQLKVLADPRQNIPLRNFTVEGRVLFADVQDVWARIKVAVAIALWEPQFADAFATLLSSYLSVPLLQDVDLAAEKEAKALGTRHEGGTGGMFGRMIAQDRASEPVGASQSGPGHPLDVGRGVSR